MAICWYRILQSLNNARMASLRRLPRPMGTEGKAVCQFGRWAGVGGGQFNVHA